MVFSLAATLVVETNFTACFRVMSLLMGVPRVAEPFSVTVITSAAAVAKSLLLVRYTSPFTREARLTAVVPVLTKVSSSPRVTFQ